MRYTILRRVCLIVAAMSLTLTCAAQTISAVPEGVERYALEMNAVMSSSGPVSLEKAFEEGFSAAEALEPGQLSRLDEPTFQKVKSMMIGFYIRRVEVFLARPDVSFFLKLAREKGTKADKAFFEVLKKTYPKSYWAVYMQRETDYGGCYIFDGKTLSETYGMWASFQKAYPNHYQGAVGKELARIQKALESNCACGGEDEYLQELKSFLKTYPASPFNSDIASRLEAVNKKAFKMRFHCRPH